MSRRMIDPPEGWLYGFPKEVPDYSIQLDSWLVLNGYPKELIEKYGDSFHCRFWVEDED